jgi:molybdopterin biosynthesis enzyme
LKTVGSQHEFTPLAALDEVLALLLASSAPLKEVTLPVDAAIAKVIARDIMSATALPQQDLALCDGFAVTAQDTFGATSLNPNILLTPLEFVTAGQPLPLFADAVLPSFAVDSGNKITEILAAAVPGEGIRRRGDDVTEAQVLIAAGETLSLLQAVILRHANIASVPVLLPKVSIFSAAPVHEGDFVAEWLANLLRGHGADANIQAFDGDSSTLAAVLLAAKADFIIILRRPGLPQSEAIQALAKVGVVLAHGLAARPGETMVCGLQTSIATEAPVPVIMVPDRLEQVLAAWLLLVRPTLDNATHKNRVRPGKVLRLNRKIASPLGKTDLVLLEPICQAKTETWEPLSIGELPWRAVAKAKFWLVIAQQSEGYAKDEEVFAEYL